MNKKGFVFVETICVVVVLLSTLILLYSSFNKVITREQRYLYYDDISYVYKAEYLKRIIYNSIDTYPITSDDGTVTSYYNSLSSYINYWSSNMYNSSGGITGIGTYKRYLYVLNSSSHYIDSEGNTQMVFPYNGYQTINDMMDFYNVWQTIYIKTDDIDDIKSEIDTWVSNNVNQQVINDVIDPFTFDKNKDFFKTYLKKLDVDSTSHQGILIFIFFESKNGINDDSNELRDYKNCFSTYSSSPFTYNYTEKTMQCEATPYIAWVYYD